MQGSPAVAEQTLPERSLCPGRGQANGHGREAFVRGLAVS